MHAGTKNRCLTTWLYSIRPFLDGRTGRGGREKQGSKKKPSRAKGREDIASKQQGSPFRTDYNKLATLIETKGKLSALFTCNAMRLRVHRKSATFVTVSVWYSLDSFNSSLKAFGVMNRKPFRKKDIIRKGWLRTIDCKP